MEKKILNTAEYIKIIKESPEKKKAYAFIIVSVVVVIILAILAIRPTLLTISKITKEIKEKERIDTALTQKITTLSELDKQYSEYNKDFRSLKLIYPADGNYSLLLSNIESIVSRNGYAIGSIGFDKYENTKNYKVSTKLLMPWSLRVSAKGKVTNLINLLKDLESMPMYPVVESVSYSSQVDKEGLTTFSINIRIYHIENSNFYK